MSLLCNWFVNQPARNDDDVEVRQGSKMHERATENAPETRCHAQELRMREGRPINRVLRMRASSFGWDGLVRDMRQPPP